MSQFGLIVKLINQKIISSPMTTFSNFQIASFSNYIT